MEEQQSILLSNYDGLEIVPNAKASLVLGILSIIGLVGYGIVGIVCGIIGLRLANKGRALYIAEPERYLQSSIRTSIAGRICAIIGLILSSIVFLCGIALIYFLRNVGACG
jgi:hypothetical protein